MQSKPFSLLSALLFLGTITVQVSAVAVPDDAIPPQPMPPGSKDVWQPPVGVDKAHNEWCTHVQCNKGGIYDPWLTMETCIANGFNYHEEGHCWNNSQQWMYFKQFVKDCEEHAKKGWSEPVWHGFAGVGVWRTEILKANDGIGASCDP